MILKIKFVNASFVTVYHFWILVSASEKEELILTSIASLVTGFSTCFLPAVILHSTDNIPYSLALRIVRICTDTEERDARMLELKEMLLSGNYPKKLINNNIERALAMPRTVVLKRVVRKSDTDRVVFTVTYNPALPSVPAIVGKHHRTMVNKDPMLKEVFTKPPPVAY